MTTTSRSEDLRLHTPVFIFRGSHQGPVVKSLNNTTFLRTVLQMKGVNIEAVLRVEEDEEKRGKVKNKSRKVEVEDDLGLSMLIDSQNNQYVLTKPRDSTMPRADHHFIKVGCSPALPSSEAANETNRLQCV